MFVGEIVRFPDGSVVWLPMLMPIPGEHHRRLVI
jgi:hypothetical protein